MKFYKAIRIRSWMVIIGLFLCIISMIIASIHEQLPCDTLYVFIVNIGLAFVGILLIMFAFKRGFLIDKEENE